MDLAVTEEDVVKTVCHSVSVDAVDSSNCDTPLYVQLRHLAYALDSTAFHSDQVGNTSLISFIHQKVDIITK